MPALAARAEQISQARVNNHMGRPLWVAAHLLAWLSLSSQALISQSASDPDRELRASLTRMLDDNWHPMLTDPEWLALRSRLDSELQFRPNGPLAMLARRAAVRIEFAPNSLVSQEPGTGFDLDTRPWFQLKMPLRYLVEIDASEDGDTWLPIAAAFDSSRCGASVGSKDGRLDFRPGMHRLQLRARVALLRSTPGPEHPDNECVFAGGPPTASNTWPRAQGQQILGEYQQSLAGISFMTIASGDPDPLARRAATTSAHAIDPSLPPVPLERWLNLQLSGHPAWKGPSFWMIGYCNVEEAEWYPGDSIDQTFWPAASAARRQYRSICATALNGFDDRVIGIRLKVARVREDTGEWQFEPASFHEGFVEDNVDGIDLKALSDLPTALQLPRRDWPITDLRVTPIDVSLTPTVPKPGDEVQVKVLIRNVGSRDVRWAHGFVLVEPCCARQSVARDFLGPIPAGETLTVEQSVVLPSGTGWVTAMVWPWLPNMATGSGFRPSMGDSFVEDDFVVLEIGEPILPL